MCYITKLHLSRIFPLFKGPGRAHTGPCGPIWAHMGPYIWAHTGPCGAIWAHMGPYGPRCRLINTVNSFMLSSRFALALGCMILNIATFTELVIKLQQFVCAMLDDRQESHHVDIVTAGWKTVDGINQATPGPIWALEGLANPSWPSGPGRAGPGPKKLISITR